MRSGAEHLVGGRLQHLAGGPIGVVVLVLLALLEATVFPAPTEAMLIALVLARRDRALWFTAAAVLASVVGGVIGYAMGATVFADVVRPVLESYGFTRYIDVVGRVYAENMLLALVTSGYTPVPYMLYTALAGASHLSLPTLVIGSFIGRALKYAPLALLAYLLGPRVHQVVRRYGIVATVAVVALLAVVLILR